MNIIRYKTKRFCCLTIITLFFGAVLLAEEPDPKKIESAIFSNPKDKKAAAQLEQLSGIYLSAGRYKPFIDFLKKLKEKKKFDECSLPVSYYYANSLLKQLNDWETANNWQEYFDNRAAFLDDIESSTQKIIKSCPDLKIQVRAQEVCWLALKSQNDPDADNQMYILSDMIDKYAGQPDADIRVIKDAADSLYKQGEVSLARAKYDIFVNKLVEKEASAEKLKGYAETIVSEGNLDLAQIIYERYLELAKDKLPKELLSAELIAIAGKFADDGTQKAKEGVYAERIFALLEESCPDFITEDVQYLRAYNLERLKDYRRIVDEYKALSEKWPSGKFRDEADFKLGVLTVYILKQKEQGIVYFNSIIERAGLKLEFVVSSLYQRAILYQYEEKNTEAQNDYTKIMELAGSKPGFSQLLSLTEQRKKEIETNSAIFYNLKFYLDSIFSPESISLPIDPQAAKVSLGLQALPCRADINEPVKISVGQIVLGTGCLAPNLGYIWSGELGGIKQVPIEPEFTASYGSSGVKVINLVVTTSSGYFSNALEIVTVPSE